MRKHLLFLFFCTVLPLFGEEMKINFPRFTEVKPPILLKPYPTLSIARDGNWLSTVISVIFSGLRCPRFSAATDSGRFHGIMLRNSTGCMIGRPTIRLLSGLASILSA